MKHQNYDFLMAVANGEDLSEWEYRYEISQRWHPANNRAAVAADRCFHFRRKQKTITINGIEVPEPMRVAPEFGDQYWTFLPYITSTSALIWTNSSSDKGWFAYGLCHSTKKAAEQHRRALILASSGDPDYKDE